MSTGGFDVNTTCRICLQKTKDMISLFHTTNFTMYGEALHKCTNLSIEENDGLPLGICETCVKDLFQAHNFIIKCIDSDEKLRKLIKNENITEYACSAVGDSDSDDEKLFKLEIPILNSENEETNYIKGQTTKEESVHSSIIGTLKRKYVKKLKKVIKSGPIKCPDCGLLVKHKSSLILHQRTHTGERPYPCSGCEKSFRDKATLSAHEKRFHSDIGRTFACEICGKLFYRKSNLNVHLRIHSGLTPFKCLLCPKAFSQSSSLHSHNASVHSKEKPFPCEVCHKMFSRKNQAKRHVLVHSNEKNFGCTICGIMLKSERTLKIHSQLHRNKKQFICELCGSGYSTKGNLRIHIKCVHSEKSGVCSLCNKRFSKLQDHMRIHLGETPFQCHMCVKSFALERSLKSHLTEHQNAEKFHCEVKNCGKTFAKKHLFDFHVLKFHKTETPHVCTLCQRGFLRLGDLKLHMQKSHKSIYVKSAKSKTIFHQPV